jgi:transposase-like protein
MKKTRRSFTATFKEKVAIESLKERSTLQQLAEKFNLHPNQISTWKKEFIENADRAFEGERQGKPGDLEKMNDELYKQIGQLQVENNWLKKKVL